MRGQVADRLFGLLFALGLGTKARGGFLPLEIDGNTAPLGIDFTPLNDEDLLKCLQILGYLGIPKEVIQTKTKHKKIVIEPYENIRAFLLMP